MKQENIDMSIGKVLDTAKTITAIRVNMPENGQVYTKTMFLTEKHQRIKPLFNLKDGENLFEWRIDETRKKL